MTRPAYWAAARSRPIASRRLLRVLQIVDAEQKRTGRACSFRQVARRSPFAYLTTVLYLQQLRADGLIDWDAGTNTTIRVIHWFGD